MKLSVVVAAFDERATIAEGIRRVRAGDVGLDQEILVLDGRADVVYGSRFLGGPHRVLYFWHYVGNRFLTTFSNMLSNLNLTDMETCYKVVRREVLGKIKLKSSRFGFEPEITMKLAKLKCRVYEVPISYSGRDS